MITVSSGQTYTVPAGQTHTGDVVLAGGVLLNGSANSFPPVSGGVTIGNRLRWHGERAASDTIVNSGGILGAGWDGMASGDKIYGGFQLGLAGSRAAPLSAAVAVSRSSLAASRVGRRS